MAFLFIIAIILFILPWLIIPLAIFFLFNLLLLPFGFTLRSLLNLITIPKQIWQIALNRRLRINHALEHATINVLEEHYGPQKLAGFAQEDGFFLKGTVQPNMLEEAARIGLGRMLRGEHNLAVHDRCGTSIAAANFLAAIVFILLLLVTHQFTLLNVVLAMITANLLGPFLGKWLQTHFTTLTDVGNVEIVGVEYRTPHYGLFPIQLGFIPMEYFVRTRFYH
ncbi:MAG: hypothetical protein GX349_01700 [Firmicutes bacterium]|nr:hypothetical protein [Bacillota bacterium]